MKALVIGGDGLIGGVLVEALKQTGHEVIATSRRELQDGWHVMDLADSPLPPLPSSDVTYLIAGMPKFSDCEGSSLAWRVNVDAPVEIIRQRRANSFMVFLSSDAVEWCGGTALARMKAQVESIILPLGGAVVRATKVAAHQRASLCQLLVRVGKYKSPGVHRWP